MISVYLSLYAQILQFSKLISTVSPSKDYKEKKIQERKSDGKYTFFLNQ